MTSKMLGEATQSWMMSEHSISLATSAVPPHRR